jgi:hypothetical protein
MTKTNVSQNLLWMKMSGSSTDSKNASTEISFNDGTSRWKRIASTRNDASASGTDPLASQRSNDSQKEIHAIMVIGCFLKKENAETASKKASKSKSCNLPTVLQDPAFSMTSEWVARFARNERKEPTHVKDLQGGSPLETNASTMLYSPQPKSAARNAKEKALITGPSTKSPVPE